jgi:Flp pilus assembly protein TadD
MGEHEKAELQFRAAVALSPLDAEARNKLGKLYFDTGRLAEAEEQFRRSVESKPNWTAYSSLGDIYLRGENPARAEQAFCQVLTLNPFDSHAHFSLGGIYAASGRRNEAIREYQAGLETDPANAQAHAALEKLRSKGAGPKTPKP